MDTYYIVTVRIGNGDPIGVGLMAGNVTAQVRPLRLADYESAEQFLALAESTMTHEEPLRFGVESKT